MYGVYSTLNTPHPLFIRKIEHSYIGRVADYCFFYSKNLEVTKIFHIFAIGVGRTHSGRGALCTHLANGNVGNFHSNVQAGTTVSTLYAWGCDPISH